MLHPVGMALVALEALAVQKILTILLQCCSTIVLQCSTSKALFLSSLADRALPHLQRSFAEPSAV